jgi:hypothetical protein
MHKALDLPSSQHQQRRCSPSTYSQARPPRRRKFNSTGEIQLVLNIRERHAYDSGRQVRLRRIPNADPHARRIAAAGTTTSTSPVATS